jgi:hypothetical protein
VTKIHSVFKATAHFQSSMSCPRVVSLENKGCSPVVSHNNPTLPDLGTAGCYHGTFSPLPQCSFDGMLIAKYQELKRNHAIKADEMQPALDSLVN